MVSKRIVKLGGSAITNKATFETVDESALDETIKQFVSCANAQFTDTVVVHGAGSFGHFQAKEHGVASGGIEKPTVRLGFAATRVSVTKLNHIVVSKLIEAGVPACGLAAFGAWRTANRKVVEDGLHSVRACLQAGLLPVLHGDAVLDDDLGCTILSGDVIICHLAEALKPETVVFLTNVDGVFDRPPHLPGAVLLSTIDVHPGGSWVASTAGGQIQLETAAHDTTGGMEAKVNEAAQIAAMGMDVYIVKIGTPDALTALGFGKDTRPDGSWTGTHVRLVHQ